MIRSEDGVVREVKVEIVKEGDKKSYLRPIKELILLLLMLINKTITFLFT